MNINLFSLLPNELLIQITSHLSKQDLKCLTAVDKYCQEKIIQIYGEKVLKYQNPPSLYIEGSLLNHWNVSAVKYESIPILGYLISIPRCLGGGIAALAYSIQALKSRYDQGSAKNEYERRAKQIDSLYIGSQIERSLSNLGTGLGNSIPIISLSNTLISWASNTPKVGDPSIHILQEQTIEYLRLAWKLRVWIGYISREVFPDIEIQHLATEDEIFHLIKDWSEGSQWPLSARQIIRDVIITAKNIMENQLKPIEKK